MDYDMKLLEKEHLLQAQAPGLARLIHPMPVGTFLEEYWEKKPLHLVRNNPGYYDGLISLEELDSFHRYSLTNDNSRLAKDGRSYPLEEKGPEKTNISQLYESYSQGNTLVTRNLHERWAPVAAIANQLFMEFGCEISTHLYPTPESSQGFSIHWDDHDIFALQLEGEKYWELYDGGPQVPILTIGPKEAKRQSIPDPGQPSHKIMLKAGDLLYFPRGMIHCARALEKSSLHLTYGLYANMPESVVKQAVKNHIDPGLDEPLPLGFLSYDLDRAKVIEAFGEIRDRFVDGVDMEAALIDLAGITARNAPPQPSKHFGLLTSELHIGAETMVAKRAGSLGVVAVIDHEAQLSFPGGKHREPVEMAPALKYLCNQESARTGDLPGNLDDPARIRLVKTLVNKGFLSII